MSSAVRPEEQQAVALEDLVQDGCFLVTSDHSESSMLTKAEIDREQTEP